MKNKLRPFHLAFPVFDIEETIKWYTENFSCSIGRKDTRWVDFNFFGHQISAHLVDKNDNKEVFNQVDNEDIPVRHFGIILTYNQWEIISKQLIHNGIKFIIKPQTRFKGEIW